MNERSIAERLPRLLVELEDAFETNNDDPYRFVYRKMQLAAKDALANGMRTAAEIVEAARTLRTELAK